MKTLLRITLTLGLLILGACMTREEAATAGAQDRTVLPVPDPEPAPITELDARNATPPPRFEVKAPEGAPNVVIVLIDDIGFGTATGFGGTIRTPTLDRLAEERPALQPVPHHRAVLPHAYGDLDRSQPSLGQLGLGDGGGHGLPG